MPKPKDTQPSRGILAIRGALTAVFIRHRATLEAAACAKGLTAAEASVYVVGLPNSVMTLPEIDDIASVIEQGELTLPQIEGRVVDLGVSHIDPRHKDFFVIRDAIGRVFDRNRDTLIRIAGTKGIRREDADDAVSTACAELLMLRPRNAVLAFIRLSSFSEQDLMDLEDALLYLLIHYLGWRALDVGRRVQDRRETHIVADRSTSPNREYETRLRLAEVGRAILRLRHAGEVDDRQWSYWCWRSSNPDAPDSDFSKSLNPGVVNRTRNTLFANALEELRSPKQQKKLDHTRKKGPADPFTR